MIQTTLLPAWGPYNKYLAGTCFATDADRGVRVEVSFFPALYRRRQSPPFLAWDSGFTPWEAAPDLQAWTYRFPLADSRDFYADIRYEQQPCGVNIVARFVNGTGQPQSAALHGLIARRLPEAGPYRAPALRMGGVDLPAGAQWISGADYRIIHFRETSFDRHLPADARPLGVVYRDGLVGGMGLGDGFGTTPGDAVTYALPVSARRLFIRGRAAGDQPAVFQLSGAASDRVVFAPGPQWSAVRLTLHNADIHTLTLTSTGGGDGGGNGELLLDGIAVLADDADPLFFQPAPGLMPSVTAGKGHLSFAYPEDPGNFTLAWPEPIPALHRYFLSNRLEYDFPLATHNHVSETIGREGEQPYLNLFLRPIPLAAGETREVRLRLRTEMTAHPAFTGAPADPLPAAPAGVARLRATLLTNVVFPVQYKRGLIAHHCPGKFWDSLYTWDSGFIGLGMCEVNPALAEEILARYLCTPEDDFAYVHHGSTVPVQIHLLQTLCNRLGGAPDLLRKYFPGVRRMHRFLAGRAEGSVTARLKSGLLNPFPYFYNSGGWDDYPPQWRLWHEKDWQNVSPVITTAQLIRTAKILRRAACMLGEDSREFDADIHRLTQALFTHAWHADSGWFSYIRHDAQGQALNPMLHESGENFNAGLDGLYPLLAGICPPEMESEFVNRLRDPKRFWSPVGISTVDMSAATYKTDGYWNGSVWMPHQWFIWRYLLDIGESDFALAIAERALEIWEREVNDSWCCFEHFPIATERGAGWHHFGGLSAPILNWHAALKRPGCLSGGYNTWILAHAYTPDSLQADLLLDGRETDQPVLWVAHPADRAPRDVTWSGGGNCTAHLLRPGLTELRFTQGQDQGQAAIAFSPASPDS